MNLRLSAPIDFDDTLELNEVRLREGVAFMSHETLRENIVIEAPPRVD